MMTKDEIAAIRAEAEAATPGPWSHAWDTRPYHRDGYKWSTFAIGPAHGLPEHRSDDNAVFDAASDRRNADAWFIAHARTNVPRLCDEVDRLMGEVGELRETLANERGEGAPPVDGWDWNGDICWEHRNLVHRVECYAVGEWRVQENDGRWVAKSTHATAREAMRAASAAIAAVTNNTPPVVGGEEG